MRVPRAESAECARICDRGFARAPWAEIRGWMLLIGAALCIALVAMLNGSAYAGVALEERKLPMKFSWVACQPNCRGWVSAVGIVTGETPGDFDDFARDHQLKGETVVLDSSGGAVNDSITLGRRFRELGMLTTVGVSVLSHSARGERAKVSPEAYCESMCVFLLLSASCATCRNRRMSACIRSGWATALTMRGQRVTAQMI